MTVIPASALRHNQNANIIQIPNFPTSQQIQHIPGIGNVQVISANALSGANFMGQPLQVQQIHQSPVIQNQPQQNIKPETSTVSTPTSQASTTKTITITPQSIKQDNETTPTKWIVKSAESAPVLIQASSASVSTSQTPTVTTQSQTTSIMPTITHISSIPSSSTIQPVTKSIVAASTSNQITIQPAPVTISSSASETKTTSTKMSTTISVTPAPTQQTVSQTSVNVNINVSSADGSASPEVKPRVRRVACTCPNCTQPDRNTDRKKQHICHVPGCNKVYGKTSHLRAHLRWHTGKN